MRTAFLRGFHLGTTTPALREAYELAYMAGIPVHDYGDCAEDELRAERQLITEALELADFRLPPADDDEAERRALERIPEHLREGLLRYLDEHVPTGHFLQAVLVGDLHDAMGRADTTSRANLFELCSFLHNFAPSNAWGSKRAVEFWLTPVLPRLQVKELRELVAEPRCPRCGNVHPLHHRKVNEKEITLDVAGETMAQVHIVQYVWCARQHLEVVTIDGRDYE